MELPAAAHLNPAQRFKRLAEGEKGAVLGQGGFGCVFQGYDVLTGEQCIVKLQRHDDQAAAKEVAAFNFFSALPHDNVLRMVGMFVDTFT